jgi:hypothetical protein
MLDSIKQKLTEFKTNFYILLLLSSRRMPSIEESKTICKLLITLRRTKISLRDYKQKQKQKEKKNRKTTKTKYKNRKYREKKKRKILK